MTILRYNIIVVTMMPDFIDLSGAPWPVLPAGIHDAALSEVQTDLTTNGWRRRLFNGLVRACSDLAHAGCGSLYLDGSFVTENPWPGDYDACWHPMGVDRTLMNPGFLIFPMGVRPRKRNTEESSFHRPQKQMRMGERSLSSFRWRNLLVLRRASS